MMLMAFTAKDAWLCAKTGVGMMDCKSAYTGRRRYGKAVDILREKGVSPAAKKSSRIAAEGLFIYVDRDKKVGAMVEVNSRLIVAKNADFQSFVQKIAKLADKTCRY